MKREWKTDPDIDDLFEAALAYLDVVKEKLWLESLPIERRLECSPEDEMFNAIATLSNTHPDMSFDRARHVIYYIFPNLMDSDPKYLEDLHRCANSLLN